jgi:hypothetical protein
MLWAASPPTPRLRVFRDRSTGTDYYLSHSGSEVVITTPLPTRELGRPEEPTLRAPLGVIRLYVEAGALRYEVVALATDPLDPDFGVQDEPVGTRNFAEPRTTILLSAGAVFEFGDPLCLVKLEGLGLDVVETSLGCEFFVIPAQVVFTENVFVEGVFV